jgi:UDP-N-acetylmuramyl pentapeptide phosphotransferase/UDP-N-acetylglucosamine-1-phosphate transferase
MFVGAILLLSLAFSNYLLRKILWISHKAGLYDHPTECRKVHADSTPHLGGAALMVSFLLIAAVSPQLRSIPEIHILLLTSGAIFLIGIADDLAGMNPYKKLLAQTVIAVVLVSNPAYRIAHLHGLLGIEQIGGFASFSLTVLFVLASVNAMNLIDGINWLASGLSLAAFTTLAVCFHQLQEPGLLALCAAVSGALVSFMYFNRTPARIFLGDSGSLLCGFLVSIAAIRLLQHPQNFPAGDVAGFLPRIPMILAAILFIPYLDMLRVFFIRLASGRPPFSADRSHIHHRLLDAGYSHLQASSLLIAVAGAAQLIALAAPVLPFPYFIALLVLTTAALSLTWQGKPRRTPRVSPAVSALALASEQPALTNSTPYTQFIKGFLRGNQLDKKHQPEKMQEMQEMEVPVK